MIHGEFLPPTRIHLFQKTLSERKANGSCRTEIARPKGTLVSIFGMQKQCVLRAALNWGAQATTTRTAATKTIQICTFDNEKQYFCTLCTCIFHLLTFFEDVLVLSMTWNDLFCSCVDNVTWAYDRKCWILSSPKRWFQFNSRIVNLHCSGIIT